MERIDPTSDQTAGGADVSGLDRMDREFEAHPAWWARVSVLHDARCEWGGGSPATPIPRTREEGRRLGLDCGGAYQVIAVIDGDLKPGDPDRGTHALARAGRPIPVGQQRPGDLAYYSRGHVMAVASQPRADLGGHSSVYGMSGATSRGPMPWAGMYGRKTALYRSDFAGYFRLGAE